MKASGTGERLAIALERSDGSISVFRTSTLPHQGANAALNVRYVERLLKFLLWQKGGYRVTVGGQSGAGAIACGRFMRLAACGNSTITSWAHWYMAVP